MLETMKEWQHSAVALANTKVVSWREIAELLKIPKSTVSDFLRKYFTMANMQIPEEEEVVKQREYDNERVLFISDMHIPYHHPKLLPFLEGLKIRYEPTRVVILGDECFPPDVEVLTEDGFVRFDELEKWMSVAQWKADGSIEFVQPERYVEKDYEGKLLQFKHKTMCSRTTPNHNLVKIHPKDGTVHKREAWDTKGSESWHIPRAGKHDGKGVGLLDDEIRLMVAFQADGCFTKGAARFMFTKERKIERLEHLLKSLSIPYNEHCLKGNGRQFYIEVDNVPSYFTKNFSDVAAPADYSLAQKEVFVRELEHWDGTKTSGGARYCSAVKANVEYVCMLGVLAGYSAGRIQETGNNCFYVDFRWKRESTSLKSATREEIDYCGKVYCVTVPSGMIVVRTDGHISISGNCDKHSLSFHESDPDLPSAGDELSRALPVIKAVEDMFPEADVIDSNHGSMVYRKAKHHGIPRRYIKSYNDVLGVGVGWQWHMDLVLDMSKWGVPDVYVHHGKSQKAVKTSQAMSMSHVCGHFHESFGIEYWANPKGLYFGMNCGCLIDDEQLAFAYNNANLKRPIIGTGLIIEGIPVLEAMPL